MAQLSDGAQLALDTIMQKPAKGIPSWFIHPMEQAIIERLARVDAGDYQRNPRKTYLAMQKAIGTCMVDQYIPDNPLTMGDRGYEEKDRGATTGAERVVCDGIEIDSPEAVVEHMERHVFPDLRQEIQDFDVEASVDAIIEEEKAIQSEFGPDILKAPYGSVFFPEFAYYSYGYCNYFTACALYPEVIEKHFELSADLCLLKNRATARAYDEGGFPPYSRLDHDIADSRGTLVNIKWLDKHWFPHFARCLTPMLNTDVRMIWHCDGNLMEMVPRLLDIGLHGFQGFQYEDGMDYERICRMKTKDGYPLLIIAGVSATRTLPHGTPDDVKKELSWLVDNGPQTGLFLGGTSSITPGVPWENIRTLVEGLNHFRVEGRS